MENTNRTGKGHPILGIVLGVIGILAALFLALFAGAIGGGIAIVLGVIAVLLGIGAFRKGSKGGGIVAILSGVAAVLLAVLLTSTAINAVKEIKKTAEEKNLEIAQYINKPYLGIAGIILDLPKDEAKLNELMEQLNQLRANNETENTGN